MKQITEFLPIVLFVGVYFYTKSILISTGFLMAGVLLQVVYEYLTEKAVSKRNQFIFLIVWVLGGLTLAFRDEVFIQWKPTLVNWAFCIALLVSQHFTKKNLLRRMLGTQLKLPDNAWRTLAHGWSLGFFIAGALNLVVAYNFSMDIWVSYKLIGGFAITFTYIIITMIYLVKGGHLGESATESDPADLQQ